MPRAHFPPQPPSEEEKFNAELDRISKIRRFEVFRRDPRAKLPVRANPQAVGWDVFAFCLSENGRPISRAVHQRSVTAISTGLVVQPPPGFYFQCCSRSGLAARGVFVANAPGIIDPDYTGELIVLLVNTSYETHYVAHEHRIAQLILCPIVETELVELDSAPETLGRGEAGFGSTGS